MNQLKSVHLLPILLFCLFLASCGPSIKTTGSWVNKEKLPAQSIKSVFIMAFTDKMDVRLTLENELALAAEKKGLKAYKSTDVIGAVEMKYIAPVKDVFMKKLEALNCETIFTIALVNSESETKYVPTTTITAYVPYSYANPPSNGSFYTGYDLNNAHGFGGYYNYAVNSVSTNGYYNTTNKYFLEAKMFDLKSEDLLFSIQTEAKNPSSIDKSGKQYTESLMNEIKKMGLKKKK